MGPHEGPHLHIISTKCLFHLTTCAVQKSISIPSNNVDQSFLFHFYPFIQPTVMAVGTEYSWWGLNVPTEVKLGTCKPEI